MNYVRAWLAKHIHLTSLTIVGFNVVTTAFKDPISMAR